MDYSTQDLINDDFIEEFYVSTRDYTDPNEFRVNLKRKKNR